MEKLDFIVYFLMIVVRVLYKNLQNKFRSTNYPKAKFLLAFNYSLIIRFLWVPFGEEATVVTLSKCIKPSNIAYTTTVIRFIII